MIEQRSARGCDWCGDQVVCEMCRTCVRCCHAPRAHGFVDLWWERPMPKEVGETDEGRAAWAEAVFGTKTRRSGPPDSGPQTLVDSGLPVAQTAGT